MEGEFDAKRVLDHDAVEHLAEGRLESDKCQSRGMGSRPPGGAATRLKSSGRCGLLRDRKSVV